MAKQKVTSQINLERLAGGAFAEKLNEALMQVAVDNVKSYLMDALADIPNREQITIIA